MRRTVVGCASISNNLMVKLQTQGGNLAIGANPGKRGCARRLGWLVVGSKNERRPTTITTDGEPQARNRHHRNS